MANAVGRTQCAVLENNSGGAVVRGDVVVIDSTQAKSFKTTTTGGFVDGQIGVVLDGSIADNAVGLIAFGGWVPKINLQASASLGQFVKTHTVAKQGTAHAVPSVAGDFAVVLETGTSPSAILFGLPVQSILDATTIHTDASSEIDGLTEKTTPVAGDWVMIEDSEDGFAKKKVDIDSLLGGGGGGGGVIPQDSIAFFNMFDITVGGGSMTLAKDTGQIFNFFSYPSTATNGDAAQTTISLKAGTYDVFVLGCSYNDRGIIDWSLNGVNFIAGQDWYSAGLVYNVVKTGTLTVGTSGRHLLKATVNGKNASSSSYYAIITAIWFVAQSQSAETLAAGSVPDYIKIADHKTSGTAGGTFTSGAWQTRVLNTEVVDAGNHASLSSNQITLDPGMYDFRVICPAYYVDAHQAKLYNVTDAVDVELGTNTSAGRDTNGAVTTSVISGRFTIAASKTFEVQHRCTTTQASVGLGLACSFGTEVYTVAEFWKVG